MKEEKRKKEEERDCEREKIKREIERITKRMKKKKAAGEDKILNEAWQTGCKEIVEAVTNCIEDIWMGKGLLDEWKRGVIKPIYKKRDKNDV